MITIKDLTKSFGTNEVLKGVDLEISPGKITAILGPNGSGKTTLIKSVLGMVIPDGGSILINQQDIAGQWNYRSSLSYLPQIARFPENLTIRELVAFIQDLHPAPTNEGPIIERFGLDPFLNKRLRNLSGGTRQKVNIMLSFMYDNPLVIMDEPTVGLDPVALIRLKDLIRAEHGKGKTMLFTTHIINLVEELADEIVFILEGKIFFKGTPAEMKAAHADDLELSIAKILEEADG